MTTCCVCGMELSDPPPTVCPGCFGNPIAEVAPGPVPPVQQPEPTVTMGERTDAGEPAADAGCARPGCTGVAAPGSTFCATCALLRAPLPTAYTLTGNWGAVDVPPGATVTLGRDPAAAPATAVALEHADRVSRIHATVTNDAAELSIVDTSTNGTTVNGARIPRDVPHVLLAGDRLVLGTQVEYVVSSAP